MKLTEEQTEEIKAYIIGVPRYRETYNELYDHILNSLQDIEGTFSTNLIDEIVLKDFGGYQVVYDNEKLYRSEIGLKYMKFFYLEIINTFKWQQLANNLIILCLCLVIYFSRDPYVNFKPMLWASVFCCVLICVFIYCKIIINRIKYKKESILDNYIQYLGAIGIIVMNITFRIFFNKNSMMDTSHQTKLIVTLVLFFFSSVYVRTFIKFYNHKLKILGI